MYLFALFIALVVGCAGCAGAPHPLLRAFAPENIGTTLSDATTVDVRISATADLPFLPPGYATVTSRGKKVIVTLYPPIDTEEFMELYRAELERRNLPHVKVVSASEGGTP